MAKRKVYSVEKRSSKPAWKVKQQGGKTVANSKTKAAAVKDAAQVARKDKRSSVVIRKANGPIQQERTCPRGSDPRSDEGLEFEPSASLSVEPLSAAVRSHHLRERCATARDGPKWPLNCVCGPVKFRLMLDASYPADV